jgi:hypothetical protein
VRENCTLGSVRGVKLLHVEGVEGVYSTKKMGEYETTENTEGRKRTLL